MPRWGSVPLLRGESLDGLLASSRRSPNDASFELCAAAFLQLAVRRVGKLLKELGRLGGMVAHCPGRGRTEWGASGEVEGEQTEKRM